MIDNPRIGRLLKLKGVPTVIYFKKQTPIRFTGHYTTEYACVARCDSKRFGRFREGVLRQLE